jgi:hypothetical protein
MCPGMSCTCWYWPQVEEWFAADAYKCVALDICQSVFHLRTHKKDDINMSVPASSYCILKMGAKWLLYPPGWAAQPSEEKSRCFFQGQRNPLRT